MVTTYTYYTTVGLSKRLNTVTDPRGNRTEYLHYDTPLQPDQHQKIQQIQVVNPILGQTTIIRKFTYSSFTVTAKTPDGMGVANQLVYSLTSEGDVSEVQNQNAVKALSTWDSSFRNRTQVDIDTASNLKRTKYEYVGHQRMGNVTAEIELQPTTQTELRRAEYQYEATYTK